MMLQRRDLLASALALPLSQPLWASDAATLGIHQVADGIHWVDAANAEPQAGNGGRVAHTGVITAPLGLIVVDPGPSFRSGLALREMLQDELHHRVVAVVNTHPHPENVLGNAAFNGLPIYASAITRQLMARRCTTCLARLSETLGAMEMKGTRITLPTRELRPGAHRDIAGARLSVQVFRQAHSQGDTALFDPRSGTVFGGGLAYRLRAPEMQEASTLGWLKALDAINTWPVRFFIGSGAGPAKDTLVATRDYLAQLVNRVAREIRRGGDIGGLAIEPNASWARWQEITRRHPLNVQHVWHELEDLWWRGRMPPSLG